MERHQLIDQLVVVTDDLAIHDQVRFQVPIQKKARASDNGIVDRNGPELVRVGDRRFGVLVRIQYAAAFNQGVS